MIFLLYCPIITNVKYINTYSCTIQKATYSKLVSDTFCVLYDYTCNVLYFLVEGEKKNLTNTNDDSDKKSKQSEKEQEKIDKKTTILIDNKRLI
jgi:hypothetical protein